MPVFKSAMKIARQNMGLIIMYIAISSFILSITIRSNTAQQETSFSAVSQKISFVDEDKSPLSQALEDYLSQMHQLSPCENDPVFLMEELYYRHSEYVLRIPAGFGADPAAHPLQITQVPGSYTGFYLTSQIENFLQQFRLYNTAGFSREEALRLSRDIPEPEVNMLSTPQSGVSSYRGFFQFIPYAAMCMMCFTISSVLCTFLKPELRKRTGSGAISHRQTELELLLAVMMFGVLIFGVFLVMGFAFFGMDFWQASHLPLSLLNMAVMLLVSMSVAYLVAMMATGPESISGIVNSITLGMSFLCGVFVPLELLGKGVRAAARFLPFYWYEKNCLTLEQFPTLSSAQTAELWQALGIQAVFAVAILAIGSAIHQKRL